MFEFIGGRRDGGGQIVRMQGVKLICGDSFVKLQNMPDKFVDISFTSPPYNRKRNDKYLLYNDSIVDYLGMLVEATKIMLSKTKKTRIC